LYGANLHGANLRGAKNIPKLIAAQLSILPSEGAIIGWKKVGNYLVKLCIPSEARRSNATGRKCRAEFADVLEIIGKESEAVTSYFGPVTKYKVGQRVVADDWDEDRWNECSNGIHFYLTYEEAEAHK